MRFETFSDSSCVVQGCFATSLGPVYVTQGSTTVLLKDADEDSVEFNPAECEELWPALKAFAETGDIRNADYGPRIPPLPVKPCEGGTGYGANFLSEGDSPCHAGISQDAGSEFVNLRTSETPGAEITLDQDTAERLALVLLRFARTGRIEEKQATKDVAETVDPAVDQN
jgi:hypothetical protein